MTKPAWESEGVTSNDCVKAMTALVAEITPHYKLIDQYVFELSDKSTSDALIADESRFNYMINHTIIAINNATDINFKVQGMYDRVRNTVNKALESKTKEVTINAVDEKYGGCTVSTADAQAILDEMLDQKNDAETMISFIFQSYNDVLVPAINKKIPGRLKPINREINRHCEKDIAYYVRERAYHEIYQPMAKGVFALQGEHESDFSFKVRKWLRDHGTVYTSETLQTYVDALYAASLEEGDNAAIKTSLIADNCYKSLTEAEYKWVLREVDVRRKKDQIDVYKIPDQTAHCKQILILLLRWLFGYGYTKGASHSAYAADTEKIVDQLDIHSMKILTAIPETCIFTFPTDEESKYIHEITIDVVKHCVDYNLNWEMDAAYMYWFWSYLQGESYAPTVDQENKPRDVPASAPQPKDYFNSVFKPKLRTISRKMADKLIGGNGVLFNSTAASILAPWTVEFFEKTAANDFEARNSTLDKLVKECESITTVRRFIQWVHEKVIYPVPKYVWKAFNAMSGCKTVQTVPIQFVPNNFTLFDPEYELETGLLTALNSLYWIYGYISQQTGISVTDKPAINAFSSFLYQGGLCFKLGTNPVDFNTEMYDPFILQWNPKYEPKYVRKKKPDVDTIMFKFNEQWLFRWTSGTFSFMSQGIGGNIRPFGMEDMIPFIGARCEMLPYEEYILNELLPLYVGTSGCPYGKSNPWLVTYADHIAGNGITGINTLMTVLFNGTVKRLLRCHISFPYNNILNMSFINAAHFNWFGKSLPSSAKSGDWSAVVLPQYIFSESLNESNFRGSKKGDYKEPKYIKIEPLKADPSINITMQECVDANANIGRIPCDWP